VRVSIVTAVRNGAAVIRATLDSVASQDHPQVEHIVVDGASTDDTLGVVRKHGARVAKVCSEPDSGVYHAFNKGLGLASGEIIAFLNAGDTYCSPGVVSRVARVFAQEPVDAVFGDLLIVDPNDGSRVIRRYSSQAFTPDRMARGFMPAHPTLFLRRRAYDACRGYDESYRIAGDFELCLRVFLKQRIRYRYLPENLVRMPSGGLSNRGWRSKWTITREMRRACDENSVPTSLLKLSSRLPRKLMEVFRGAP
jgi:glycosyltransferase involved in cell wall biosynthesis